MPTGVLHDGLGETCARQRGILPPRIPRPRTPEQDGPDLFDAANNTSEDQP
ncbi:hypothetical protein [Micromonospora carbonacea]|uniref:hypothetical protein n=1 Tax=Micromonospora carbonacea TaxID=47853 RepID=UPI00159F2E03|nr:hypothetical protein [Micromonospora carbonacea]